MQGDPSVLSTAFSVRSTLISVGATPTRLASDVSNRISLRIILSVIAGPGIVTSVDVINPGTTARGWPLGTQGEEIIVRYNEDGGLVTREFWGRTAGGTNSITVVETFFSPGQIERESDRWHTLNISDS